MNKTWVMQHPLTRLERLGRKTRKEEKKSISEDKRYSKVKRALRVRGQAPNITHTIA